jgi:hypothetical protein
VPAQWAPLPQQTFAPAQPASSEPDWAALAEENESRVRRRRRLRWASIIGVACLLGAGAGWLGVNGLGGGGAKHPHAGPTPSASARTSASPTGAPNDSPTVPGQPNLLRDSSGDAPLAMGPDAQVSKVPNGYVISLKNDGISYAQSADQIVDVTKSFTVSAWVYNQQPGGSRSAISEGDGASYLFDLGREDSGGHQYWSFRVQSGKGGADSTSHAVHAPAGAPTTNTWALLTGTYDAAKHTIGLYVNGKPAGAAKVPGIWAGPGPLQLGRDRKHGIWNDAWAGVIGHIQVWNQSLTPSQVATLMQGGAGLKANPVASWLVG